LTYTTFNLIMKMLGAFLPNPRALLILPLTNLALRKGIYVFTSWNVHIYKKYSF